MATPAATGDPVALIGVLGDVADAVATALQGFGDRRRSGQRPGQYQLDLVADAAALAVLHGAGLAVMSEESGRSGPADTPLLAVVDPVDGSTNCSLGLPWFATSTCVLDGDGPLAAVVVNQATGTRYDAVRGGGARRDGVAISPTATDRLDRAIVGISGFPASYPGWSQFRALGAAALDLCCVADGTLDGFCTAGRSTLHGWDYLGAWLVCTEAGAVMGERDGLDLTVRDEGRRRPVAAATAALYRELLAAPL